MPTLPAINWDAIKVAYTPGNHADSLDPTQGNEEDQLKAALLNLYEDTIQEHHDLINGFGLTVQEQKTEERTWTTIALPTPTWPDQLSLPQLSKTALIMSGVSITPVYSDSIIIVEAQAIGAMSGGNRNLALAIFKDAETDAREFSTPEPATTTAGYIHQTWIKYIMDPAGSTSAMTFYLRGMSTLTATTNFERNGSSGQFRWAGAMCCRITAREVRP